MAAAPEATPAEQPPARAMIEVENLTKVYGITTAVDNITFQVAEGEILGFLGPNGAGKSTTMRVITCYTPATAGHVRVGGHDTAANSTDVRAIIGYLPENAPIYHDMNVLAYLKFMAEIKRYPRSRRKAFIDEVIQECGLQEVTRRIVGNLSKGFRQRVVLAQALLGNPRVLVLDEPTVGLDPAQIHEIREVIKQMRGRRTVILSTHILPEVSMICQKVIIINRGRIEAEGTPEHLVSRMGGVSVVMATVEGPPAQVQEIIGRVAGVSSVKQDRDLGSDSGVYRIETEPGKNPRAELAKAIVGAGHDLLELQSSGLSLEDIFLRVISGQREAA